MDAGRDRLRAVDRRHHRPARTDAGRRHRRCGAFRAADGGSGGRHHRLRRAGLCAMADLSGGDGRGDAACAGELRAGSGDCGDQPRPGRAVRNRGAARAQRPFRIAWQRFGGGADGRVRLPAVEPVGVFCHRTSRYPHIDGACADPRAGDRRGAIPRRRGAGGSRYRGHQRFPSPAPAPAADLCRRRAAVSARQCGHAAADGRRRHHAVEPMGAGADCGLHHRAAGHRRVDLAFGRAQGAGMGQAAAAAAGVRRAGDPRPAVCGRERSLYSGRGAGVRRHYRGGAQPSWCR